MKKNLGAIEFDLMETGSVGSRAIDDAIWDVGWHGFECIIAPLRAGGDFFEMIITSVRIATYRPPPGEPRPTTFTAARIEGRVHFGSGAVPFLIRVGKGLAFESKRLVFLDSAGNALRLVSLKESGWHAHYRLLRELLLHPCPDLQLNLADTVTVVTLCATASRKAVYGGEYPFGTTPDFLLGSF